jgi:hypothetical protein
VWIHLHKVIHFCKWFVIRPLCVIFLHLDIIMTNIAVIGKISFTQYLFNLQIDWLKICFYLHLNCLLGCILHSITLGSSGHIPIVLNPLHMFYGLKAFLIAKNIHCARFFLPTPFPC